MKLPKSFYQQSATQVAPLLLGKYLVHKTNKGLVSGKIIDVEAYPAFVDEVSHGNKRTKRTEIMYKKGGYAYIYLIYGKHHQFAIVVNQKDVPEVVFIRAIIPEDGISLLKDNYGKEVTHTKHLTKSPGRLCKSFGITLDLYGEDLTGDKLFVEDRGVCVNSGTIEMGVPVSLGLSKKNPICIGNRVGVSNKLEGWNEKLRFYLDT